MFHPRPSLAYNPRIINFNIHWSKVGWLVGKGEKKQLFLVGESVTAEYEGKDSER